jgi:hypothetical protein
MFWILSSPVHGDFDDYTIYTDASKYPHNPQPFVPLPGEVPCTSPVIGTVSMTVLMSFITIIITYPSHSWLRCVAAAFL